MVSFVKTQWILVKPTPISYVKNHDGGISFSFYGLEMGKNVIRVMVSYYLFMSLNKNNGQPADSFHLRCWVNYFSTTVAWNHLSVWN